MNRYSLSSKEKKYITADHITYSDTQLTGETDNTRLWTLLKQVPTNEAEYTIAKQQSLYWYYITKLGCGYNAAIHRRLKMQ